MPSLYKTRIKHISWQGAKTILVVLDLVHPKKINFQSGQFVSVKVDKNSYRAYSICSNSKTKTSVSLFVSAKHQGVGSNYFRNAKVGDLVDFVGPAGKFKFPNKLLPSISNIFRPENWYKSIVFVCTGTGIAPFISMLHYILSKNLNKTISLYWGIQTIDDLAFLDELEYFKSKFRHFNYFICLSQQKNFDQLDKKTFLQGKVTLNFKIDDKNKTKVFLCGNPNMVDDMNRAFEAMSFFKTNVYFEKFTTALK